MAEIAVNSSVTMNHVLVMHACSNPWSHLDTTGADTIFISKSVKLNYSFIDLNELYLLACTVIHRYNFS